MSAVHRKAASTLKPAALLLVMLGFLAPFPAQADNLDAQSAAWAAKDALILRRAAPRLIDSALSPTFDAMDERVTAYADWVFGWLSSLVTAWDLAYVGVSEAARQIADGNVPEATSVHDRLANVVIDQFDSTVVLPQKTASSFDTAWRQTVERLMELDRELSASRRARITLMAGYLGEDPAAALARHGGPILSDSLAASAPPSDLFQRAMLDADANAGGTADPVLLRSLRPLATRVASLTTRLLLAPVAGGLIASPVMSVSGVAAAAGTWAAVSAGIWGLDYAANRVDSALSRPAFEAGLRRLVRDAHSSASLIARRDVTAAVCDALTVGAPCTGPIYVAAPSPTR